MLYAVIGPLVVAVLVFLLRSRRAEARREGSGAVVAHTPVMKGLGVVFLLFPCVLCVLAFVFPPRPEERWLPVYLIAGFLCLAIPVALEAHRRRLVIEDDVLLSESPWTGTRRIPWSEITAVTYSPSMSWYVIEARALPSVRVSSFMSGLATLGRAIAERAPEAANSAGTARLRAGRAF